MTIARLSLALFAGTALAAASVQGVTIATFADPAAGPSTPLFAFNSTTGVLTGQWLGQTNPLLLPNLLFQTPGVAAFPDFPDARFQMTPVVTTGSFGPVLVMGPGSVSFFDSTNAPLMTISFSGGLLNPATNFGSSDFTGFNVVFSGPILAGLTLANESFAFSFANAVSTTTPPGYTVTSSFTSSADIIPAPASVALLGLGGLVAIRRRR